MDVHVNLTISSVNKLKTIWRFSPFSLLSLSFLSLFVLFCISSLCQRVVLLNFLDIKVNPNSLLFSKRERERERVAEVQSRGGGALVLGKFSMPGRPTNWKIVGQWPIALAVGAVGVVRTFFLSSIFFLFFLPLWQTARYRLKYCLKGSLNPK